MQEQNRARHRVSRAENSPPAARLLARLRTNLQQTSEPELRARLLAAIEQLTKENGAGKS